MLVNNYINSSIADYIIIFDWSTTYSGISYRPAAKLNDVRIYDHCLSPKEVKEISKGLVLHYPLNDAYVERTSNLFSTNLTYSTNWNNSGSATWNWNDNTISKINNSIIYSISRTDNGNSAIGCGRCNLVAGKTYTASVYVYLSGNTDSNIFYVRSVDTHIATLKYSNDTNPQKWPQNQWIRATAIFTPSAAYNNCYICTYLNNANSKRALTCWQIEEKDHVTPYTPNTRNETIVHDCSGYQNNGTVSGNITLSVDSPRYIGSYKFIPNAMISTPGIVNFDKCTYSVWCKDPNMSYKIVFCDGTSKVAFGESSGFLCSCGSNSQNKFTKNNWKNSDWNHVVVVRDGSTYKMYINGKAEIQSGTADYWSHSASTITVGGREENAAMWNGNISDFRIYSTALSADDIKELYNTSCIINS